MQKEKDNSVKIRLWSEEDLPLLQHLMGDPKMTEHLGGAESSEKIQQRHTKYCNLCNTNTGKMFAILYGEQDIPVGSIGYWEKTWLDMLVWETGWSVLPEFQGLGIATLATKIIIERVRAEERHPFLHAFPSIKNGASNAICKKVGFRLLGQYDFEYPIGNLMTCNDWQVDLFAST